jgi:hypothetical protein
MTTNELMTKIDIAIQSLYSNDINLLQRAIHERNIAFKLSMYLQPLFVGYNVDCEYNGDMGKPNDKKALEIAANRIRELRRIPHNDNIYKFTPDIIIHVRGQNDRNIAVIEIKKDRSNRNKKEYDLLKLEHLTIDYSGNHYNYQIGIAIIFGTGINAGTKTETFYQNGIKIDNRLELR